MQGNGGSGNETVFMEALWEVGEDLAKIFRRSVDNW